MSTNKEPASLREKIKEIIFGVHTPAGFSFDLLLLVVIVLSVISNSLETVKWIGDGWTGKDGVEHAGWHDVLVYAKWIFTILFTIEYLTRIFCVNRPLKYIFSFWGIIDLLAILPDYFLLLFAGANSNAFSVIRSLRLLRIFRIMNLSWFQREGEDLGNAIWRARGKVTVFLIVVMIIVTVAGTVMYEIENTLGDPETTDFTSIPNGIYWAIVTMTTVGFGDIVPETSGGKIISAVLILVGYSLIIVPTGFVSAEVIDAKKEKLFEAIHTCDSCNTTGHDDDARFCKYCGDELNPV